MASGLKVDWPEEDQKLGKAISVPPDVYAKGCVRDVDHGLRVSMFAKFTVYTRLHVSFS